MNIRGYGFVEAVEMLAGSNPCPVRPAATAVYRETQKAEEKKQFRLPWPKRCATFAVSYLQRRGISSQVISQCFRSGLFYESRYKGEAVCVFVGRDEAEKEKFACMRGIGGGLKKMSMAVISGIVSVSRQWNRGAVMWRCLKLLSMPSLMLPCRNWKDGNGMATACL